MDLRAEDVSRAIMEGGAPGSTASLVPPLPRAAEAGDRTSAASATDAAAVAAMDALPSSSVPSSQGSGPESHASSTGSRRGKKSASEALAEALDLDDDLRDVSMIWGGFAALVTRVGGWSVTLSPVFRLLAMAVGAPPLGYEERAGISVPREPEEDEKW